MNDLDFDSALHRLLEKTAGRPQHLWRILTALRSCDKIDPSIQTNFKNYTTARLRGFLGFSNSYFDARSTPLTKEEREARDKWLGALAPYDTKITIHFWAHWQAAVEAVRKCYGYDLETETVYEPTVSEGLVE